MQRPLPWKELLGDRAPTLRSTAAMLTSFTALAATSLIAAPSAVPLSEPCTLRRTQAHHSEGLDTWNSAYPRPTRDLDAVLVFLSFPDAAPLTTPAELTADHFPATSEFFERASYGKFALRPHPRREWLEMPQPSTAYAIRRDWNATHRAAYLRDALATADPHVDFSRYDIVYFVADPHAPGVDSDATKVVNLETPLEVDGTGLRRVVTVFERHPRTASSSPMRPAMSSTSPTSITAPPTARVTGTPMSATGTSWAASSPWHRTCSPGTSGSWAGWNRAR